MKKKYVYPDLARRGLGNMLFTWAQAVAYRHRSGGKLIAPVWSRITRVGPWLRHERYKRYYGGLFTCSGYVSGIRKWLLLLFCRSHVKIFTGMDGYFKPFMAEWDIIKAELYRIVNKKIMLEVKKIVEEGDFIGVHIRRGDFAQAGCMTEDAWFVRALKMALDTEMGRRHHLIRVFTDGYPEEVDFLRNEFPNERLVVMPKAPAIQDIVLMSQSLILVCSPASTFSMWATFLGQMPSVWKKGQDVPKLYPDDERKKYWC